MVLWIYASRSTCLRYIFDISLIYLCGSVSTKHELWFKSLFRNLSLSHLSNLTESFLHQALLIPSDLVSLFIKQWSIIMDSWWISEHLYQPWNFLIIDTYLSSSYTYFLYFNIEIYNYTLYLLCVYLEYFQRKYRTLQKN